MGRQRKRWGKSPEAGEGITKTAGTQQEGCLLTPDLHGVASAPQGAAFPARSLAEGCGQQRLSLRQVQALVLTLQGESSSAHEPEGSFLPLLWPCGLGAHFHDGAGSSCEPPRAVKGSLSTGKFNSNRNL